MRLAITSSIFLAGKIFRGVQAIDQIPLQSFPEHYEPAYLEESLRPYIRGILEHYHVPSMSIAVLYGNVTYVDAFGYAVLPSTPATPETLYNIGSCTKAFTAASLLFTLTNSSTDGKNFTVDSRIKDVLGSDFELPSQPATELATLKDALSHRLGMPRCDLSFGGPGFTPKEAVRSLRHLPMTAELRERWQYNNMGYMTVQHAIQKLTGKWIGDVHQEAIWGPLGMHSTVISLADALALESNGDTEYAHGYTYNPSTKKQNRQPWEDTELVGNGGIVTNVIDMSRWVRELRDGGSRLPVSRADLALLTSPIAVEGGGEQFEHMSDTLYALGWEVQHYRGERLVLHSGAIPGFATQVAFMPDKKWGVVLLSNGDGSSNSAVDAVFLKLMDDFLDVREGSRQDIVADLDIKMKRRLDEYKNTREMIYPNVPEPPTPRALPLTKYTGSFYNAGYRDIAFVISEPRPETPVANRTEAVLRAEWKRGANITIELEWVYGEQFVAWIDTEVPEPQKRFGVPAEFEIRDGQIVEAVGIVIEPALLGTGRTVRFQRMD